MPSISHESLVTLFRECPALGPELIERATGAAVPAGTTPRITSAEFSDLHPPEYRADVVVRLDDQDDEPEEIDIVEVQLDRNLRKRFAWPFYATGARARFRCPATLMVVAVDKAIAAWCAEPIEIGRCGNVYQPLVLGPSEIPEITDVKQACRFPELAVLSAAAHGREDRGEAIGKAAVIACKGLDNPLSSLYSDFVLASLNDAARRALEAFMDLRNYEFQNEYIKKYVAMGREEGREEGRRAVLIRLLTQRFGELPEDAQRRIENAEVNDLERWLERVIPAASLADVFASK